LAGRASIQFDPLFQGDLFVWVAFRQKVAVIIKSDAFSHGRGGSRF
jgi:hypothetical protein